MEDPTYKEVAWDLGHSVVARYDHQEGNDNCTQAGDLFRLISAEEQTRLIENIVVGMRSVPRDIQARQIRHFFNANPKYGQGWRMGSATIGTRCWLRRALFGDKVVEC